MPYRSKSAEAKEIIAEWPAHHPDCDRDKFSAQSPQYDPAKVKERWRNYRRSPPSRTGIGKLAALAHKAGWRPAR